MKKSIIKILSLILTAAIIFGGMCISFPQRANASSDDIVLNFNTKAKKLQRKILSDLKVCYIHLLVAVHQFPENLLSE